MQASLISIRHLVSEAQCYETIRQGDTNAIYADMRPAQFLVSMALSAGLAGRHGCQLGVDAGCLCDFRRREERAVNACPPVVTCAHPDFPALLPSRPCLKNPRYPPPPRTASA